MVVGRHEEAPSAGAWVAWWRWQSPLGAVDLPLRGLGAVVPHSTGSRAMAPPYNGSRGRRPPCSGMAPPYSGIEGDGASLQRIKQIHGSSTTLEAPQQRLATPQLLRG
jgi:hypothetical protein